MQFGARLGAGFIGGKSRPALETIWSGCLKLTGPLTPRPPLRAWVKADIAGVAIRFPPLEFDRGDP
jgi:hypothetical protein